MTKTERDICRIVKASIDDHSMTTFYQMTLDNGNYECDVEVVILKLKDKRSGKVTQLRTAAGNYRDPQAAVH